MDNYEIKVFSGAHAIIVIEAVYLSDSAAVRAARKTAGDRPFEVWNGFDRIFAHNTQHPGMTTQRPQGPQVETDQRSIIC